MTSKRTLTEFMAVIEYPRIERMRQHELLDILVLSVLAVTCSAEGWEISKSSDTFEKAG